MADELKTIKFQMMLSPSEADAIDDWGFKNRIRSRAESIRRLCEIGMRADEMMQEAGENAEPAFNSFEKDVIDGGFGIMRRQSKWFESYRTRILYALAAILNLRLIISLIKKNGVPDRSSEYDTTRARDLDLKARSVNDEEEPE